MPKRTYVRPERPKDRKETVAEREARRRARVEVALKEAQDEQSPQSKAQKRKYQKRAEQRKRQRVRSSAEWKQAKEQERDVFLEQIGRMGRRLRILESRVDLLEEHNRKLFRNRVPS